MIKPFPHYQQLDSMDCGPSCLRMIAKYYGRSYSLQNLRERSFITRQGVSMLGISDAAESIGFRTQGVRISLEQLIEDVPLPCILHWNQNHFVVLYNIKKRKSGATFKISDPGKGKYNMDISGIEKCWISTRKDGKDSDTALDNARFAQVSANQSNMVQLITGMQEIKLNNSEKQQRWKWESIQVKLFKISIQGTALGQIQQVGSLFFSRTTSLLISFLAAKAVVDGEITLGMMMSISYIIGQLSGPIGQVIGFSQSLQDAKISLERLNEINNKEDEIVTVESKINTLPEDKTIKLEDVCFSYDGAEREYVLENLNLTIPQNKVTAIVGASGSGKTTIIKLLLGFYEPLKGKIKVGNYSLTDINPHSWRQNTGAVMQEGFLFSDTIANNITLSEETVDQKKLLYAVETANIKEFIESLPLKYNSKIGMEGSGVSQGQKQRLLIARTIYKNPMFLFFDEATNALDANNERIILDNLKEFYKGRTVVIVAHRLSTVQNADNIIVLDEGKVIEEGTHKELTEKKGAYYTLVRNQLELGV